MLGSGAGPGVLRDVEDGPVGAAELGLEERVRLADILLHEAGRAHLLELLHVGVEIVDEDAEMMDADIVEPLPELVDVLELEDREIERPVAQVVAPGDPLVAVAAAGAADLLEVERLLVELGGLVRVVRRQRDVTDLRHPSSSGCTRSWREAYPARHPG